MNHTLRMRWDHTGAVSTLKLEMSGDMELLKQVENAVLRISLAAEKIDVERLMERTDEIVQHGIKKLREQVNAKSD